MGRDKRFLEVGGRPLIVRSYRIAARCSQRVVVLVSQAADLPRLRQLLGQSAEFRLDADPGAGPLAALAGALGDVRDEAALLLAVDYPRLPASFLRGLDAAWRNWSPQPPDALIPVDRGKPQYACAIYASRLAPRLLRAVEGGQRSLRGWAGGPSAQVAWVQQEIWRSWGDEDALFNWNRPSDAAPAE